MPRGACPVGTGWYRLVQVGTGWYRLVTGTGRGARGPTFELLYRDSQAKSAKSVLRFEGHEDIVHDSACAGPGKFLWIQLISSKNALVQVAILYHPVPTCTNNLEK